ncbi:LexA family protein [Floccifex sp.]|uniref:LexA family protein n=1 Tax=Floccifex sp. TaxID=2815810 RepID=UPI003F06815A
MDIQDKIKKRRLELNLTLDDVAKELGVNKSTVLRYESKSINKMPIDVIPPLAKILQCSPEYLMGWDDEYNDYNNIFKISKQKLPLLGSISCGVPIYANEERESYILCGTEIKADFCLKCHGDSMINARINDGDIVFIRKQDVVNNGEIAAVIIEDEATLKRFFYYKEQGMVILRAENPKYKDIVLTGDKLNTITIIGKAVAFQSDVE